MPNLNHASNIKRAPGRRQRLLLPYGLVAEARHDSLKFYGEMAREYGRVFRMDIGPLSAHLISHPEDIQHVLVENLDNYPRSRLSNMLLRLSTGDGLITTDGEIWRRQRRMVQPAFQRQLIANLVPLMDRCIDGVLDCWVDFATSGKTVDICEEMMRITFSVVGEALFSRDLSQETAQFGEAFAVVMKYVDFRQKNPVFAPLWMPTRRNRAYVRATKVIDEIVYDMIEQRRRDAKGRDDLLMMLLQARDEDTGEPMSTKQIRDESLTFLVAGHETTAVALTWALYLLALYPEKNDRVRFEVDSALGNDEPTHADITALPYVRAVLEEAMRLYPPIWVLARDAKQDDQIAGFHVPAKSVVLMSQYVVHRNAELWPNPEMFEPERFLPQHQNERHRFAYFPFGGGPHTCIGNEFALLEAALAIAKITQRFELELVGGHPVVPDPSFTLRPRHGLLMRVRLRASKDRHSIRGSEDAPAQHITTDT